MVPMRLEFPDQDVEEQPQPAPSTTTSFSVTPKRKRGEHGRHKKKDDVHVIHEVGPQGEPLRPVNILDVFSNQCSCIVREKVPITYDNWKSVPQDFKDHVWGEIRRRFTYPEEGVDEEKCKAHAMHC